MKDREPPPPGEAPGEPASSAPSGRAVPATQGFGSTPAVARAGDGALTEEDAGLPAGTRLGKYQIVRRLGSGGMGSVYEAVHTGIAKAVAVKTLASRLASEPR